MECPACRHENRAGRRFCGGCGAPLPIVCAKCGATDEDHERFCARCGAELAAEKPAGAAPPERDPRAYTPKHLADKILQSRSALEGERKQVTVLFADVKGSMELAELLDPEAWHRILERFFEILTEGVHRFEGTVNQYTGDGIMALFGAPITHEDHAQRACYAALHLRDALRAYGDELRVAHGLNFGFRIGMNSGEVVVGRIGDDLRMDYTAQGHTVGLAQRMEALADSRSIVLSANTARLVDGYFALRDLGATSIKGVAEALHVFELEGVGQLRTRFDRSRARGLSKFAGRAAEMSTLEAALEQALAGRGQVIGIVADAGTGKSRLCFEFVEACRARGLQVLGTTGVAHGKAVPLLPVLEFYRDSFAITPTDDARTARQKIAGNVVQNDESLVSALPLLFDFLGVPDPEKPVALEPGPERQRALLAVLKRLTLARSRREPTVMLFEDLHWIDEATGVFLENLVDAADSSRTLLVMNFRPEYRADWMRRSYYQQVALAPLDARAFAEMLGETLGADPSLSDLVDRIHARSGGNPFFAEEIVQSLIESRALEGSSGSYRLTRDTAALEIPVTVQLILAARIDRLGEREKNALQTASVIGREFSRSLLRKVDNADAAALDDALRMLVQAEFLHETAIYPEATFQFKHPLTQEVALGSQLRERRARVHAAVAQALIEIHGSQLDERAALLAHHFDAAGLALEAARWHRRAADWSMRSDYSEGRRHAQRVRALLTSLPESAERSELDLAACSQLLTAGSRLGISTEEAAALFEHGRVLASGDPRALGGLLSRYSRLLLTLGDVHGQIAMGRAMLALADREGDAVLRVGAQMELMLAHLTYGPIGEVIRLADEILSASPEIRDRGLAAVGHGMSRLVSMRGSALAQSGEIALGARETERGLALGMERGDEAQWMARGFRGHVATFQGDAATLGSIGRQALANADRLGAPGLEAFPRMFIGVGLAFEGRIEEAVASLERALDVVRVTQVSLQGEAFVLVYLAEVELLRGGSERACELSREAIGVAGRAGLRIVEARTHSVRALALLRRRGASARAEIEDELARCEALIRETEVRAELPNLHTARGELAQALGDGAGHARELREAHRLYVEMGATGHAERLAKELTR